MKPPLVVCWDKREERGLFLHLTEKNAAAGERGLMLLPTPVAPVSRCAPLSLLPPPSGLSRLFV